MARETSPCPAAGPGGLGEVGIYEFVEPRVRRLVAAHLAVGPEEFVSEVSLRDDVAADSLDLVEWAMALEAEFQALRRSDSGGAGTGPERGEASTFIPFAAIERANVEHDFGRPGGRRHP